MALCWEIIEFPLILHFYTNLYCVSKARCQRRFWLNFCQGCTPQDFCCRLKQMNGPQFLTWKLFQLFHGIVKFVGVKFKQQH